MTTPPWIGPPLPVMLQRPRCGFCADRLRPRIFTNYSTRHVPRTSYVRQEVEPGKWRMVNEPTGETDEVQTDAVSREWRGTFHSYGAFCSLRCAAAFANAAHKAGYRIRADRQTEGA
jgi:hypothetical protein